MVDNKIYTVSDLMDILKIGKNTAYSLIKSGKFPVIKIKSCYRIPVAPFHKWLETGDELDNLK